MTKVWALESKIEKRLSKPLIGYKFVKLEDGVVTNIGEITAVCESACEILLENTKKEEDRNFIQRDLSF